MNAQSTAPIAWPAKLAPITLISALAVLFIGGALRGLVLTGTGAETAELTLFVAGVLLLPILAAGAIVYAIRPRLDRPANLAETIVMAAARTDRHLRNRRPGRSRSRRTDSIAMIEKWGAEQPRITLLLGPLATGRLRYQIAAELVLMYTGKWHTWPRLLTHMDRLYPSILRKIQTADVRLDQGALTVIRKDEALLDPVEKNILATIRKQRELCPLPDIGENVSAFRIADKGACAGLPPAL